ncbi:hypothetical protein EF903_05420 [Streptomyces sp. WAC05292]|uniref:hypothetical protein n=1 Tax=Streptomyces sp. WAC05292 TaxID=2487418 RepID=UPI000F741766|nr:hypothetical protein [Streptomyces sp. WAC05292]RSS95080.1 hypothetical protein EF903_05420 [Streptomyces sp. WAC05292]
MTTPSVLAHLPTAGRRQAQRSIRLSQLTRAVETARQQHDDARAAVHRLNQHLDRTRTAVERSNRYLALYPFAPERQEEHSRLGAELAGLEAAQREAAALSAAASVAYESARLELAWLDRPHAAGPDAGRAEAFSLRDNAVNAAGYTVTVLSPPLEQGAPWRRTDYGVVRRSRARSILAAWAEQPHTHLLRDAHGRLFVARTSARLELEPTDIAPPSTEGEALRASLAVYGFAAYDDDERGFTWLVVPIAPGAAEDDARTGLHFRVSSGDRANRPASAHDEPWGASLYDGDDYVATLDAAPAGAPLAEDCAHIARAIAAHSDTLRSQQ